jgi:hypothetical protein
MVVNQIFDVITGAKQGNDGEFVDRLNHRYTAIAFVFSAIFAMSTQLLGSPIACWTPIEFHPGWQMFVENLCFVNQTYYVDKDHHVAVARQDGDIVYVWFYQWYPVIIALMAVLFFVPHNIWTGMLNSFEIDMNQMVNTVDSAELALKEEDRTSKLDGLVAFLDKHFESKKSLEKLQNMDAGAVSARPNPIKACLGACCNRNSGAYIGTFYFIIKVLCVGNALGQLFLLNYIIGPGTWLWGFEVIGDELAGIDWTNTWRFPMVTFCDFQYYESLGNIHENTVQCVLAVNLYNEKIFLFIWFWLWMMVVVNAFSVCSWFITLFINTNRSRWIEKHLLMGKKQSCHADLFYEPNDSQYKKMLNSFVSGFLKADGVFMLRIISANTTSMNTTDLIIGLYKMWCLKPRTMAKFDLAKEPVNPVIDQPLAM